MGWRTDFKKALVIDLKKIDGIGSVERSWKQEPYEYPALIISLREEVYEECMSEMTGLVDFEFTITGIVDEVEDPDEALEDLQNKMLEKVTGFSSQGLTIQKILTLFRERVEGNKKEFEFRGKVISGKDFSSM